jgi:hypothetical protein
MEELTEALGEDGLQAGMAVGRDLGRDAALTRLDPVNLDV